MKNSLQNMMVSIIEEYIVINKKIDTLIPLAGIGLVAFIYLEGIFQVQTNNIGAFELE